MGLVANDFIPQLEKVMKKPLYTILAGKVLAIHSCMKQGATDNATKHTDAAEDFVKKYMPSGSGVDSGTKLDLFRSTPDRLIFTFGYHHMNDGGYYDGWTEHTAVVTASLAYDFELRITGKDRNSIKDYLHDLYRNALMQGVEQFEFNPFKS